MIIVGLLLVVVGCVFGIDVAMGNRFSVRDIEAFGSTLGLHHAEQIFLLGAITGAVVLLGFALMVAGLSRSRSRNLAQRRQVREIDHRAAELETENQRLRSTAEEPATTRNNAGELGASEPQDERVSAGTGGSTALDRESQSGA